MSNAWGVSILSAHRNAAAARQCCPPIPGYPVIAAKLATQVGNGASKGGPRESVDMMKLLRGPVQVNFEPLATGDLLKKCVNGEEGRAWPHVVAGSAFQVQQPGDGTRDWTRTRCDDCADDWGSPSRVDGRTCGLQRFALGGACPARRKTVAGAPFFKRQPLAGRSNHGAPFFKRQRIAGRRHHATTNCDRTTARHFSSDSYRWPSTSCDDNLR